MAWTDELKAEAIALYEGEQPTPENSMEIVKGIADELDQSPNGVRMILTKAGVYIKKTSVSKSAATGDTPAKGTRVSKAAAQEALTAAITDAGKVPDEEIISKLTGKAAQYFVTLLSPVEDEEG